MSHHDVTASQSALHIAPGYEAILSAHGLNSLDALFDDAKLTALGAERLDKPGLAPWRARFRLKLSIPESASRELQFARTNKLRKCDASGEALSNKPNVPNDSGDARYQVRKAAHAVTPAKAGVQNDQSNLDSGVRRNDVVSELPEVSAHSHIDSRTVSDDSTLARLDISTTPAESGCAIQPSTDPNVETFYLKRYDNPPASARREIARSRCGAHSLAGIEWHWIQRLPHDGIPCVRGVALGEELLGHRESRSAVLTAEVPGRSLEHCLKHWTPNDRATISALIDPLADLIAAFHRAGYVHRDLYLSHVFYDATDSPPTDNAAFQESRSKQSRDRKGAVSAAVDAADCSNPRVQYSADYDSVGPARFHLIDLHRVVRPTIGAARLRVKDLAALNYSAKCPLISTCDRIRWFKRYLGVDKLDPSARRLLYWIEGKTRRIARHDARRRDRHENGSAAA